jgi:hypothetical protein
MRESWLLLIYTVPAEPSRKRAAIWREIKRAGAIYLRDGVCALPDRDNTFSTLRTIADKVEEFGGEVTLARAVQLDPGRETWITTRAREMRAAEYADIRSEAQGLLDHIHRERDHREFTFPELEELEEDLGKLRRWFGQIKSRDFTEAPAQGEVEALLETCESELAAFLEAAYEQEAMP